MKVIRTRYYHINGTPKASEVGLGHAKANYIKAEVYYDAGGYSYFTYKNNPRAYYISAVDIGRGGGYESHTLFNDRGRKQMVTEVTRQSKKREAEALAYFNENIDEFVRRIYADVDIDMEYEEV